MSRRRVAVLSPGGELAHRLLAVLAERGIELDALVLYVPSAPRYWRRLGSTRERLLALPLLPARWAAWRLRLRLDARLRRGARRVVFTGALNGARMERHLRRLDPHVLVLAGCGLLEPRILEVPREGTVGVHPALLPWVRGNGAIENSILSGVPLGCTAFRVDPGIDTGPVLERRLVPVAGGETVRALREKLRELWAEMTAGLVAGAAAGPLPPGLPQATRWPLCRSVRDPETCARIVAALVAGAARTLFERWAPLLDPRDLSLPAEALPAPAAREAPMAS